MAYVCITFAQSTSFNLMVFHRIPYFLQTFAENLMKTLKHGSLHEKLLVLAKSKSFQGFLQNPVLFATCLLNT